MTVILLVAKAVILVGVAITAFAGLAMALGVDPLVGEEVARCAASIPQKCLFTIF